MSMVSYAFRKNRGNLALGGLPPSERAGLLGLDRQELRQLGLALDPGRVRSPSRKALRGFWFLEPTVSDFLAAFGELAEKDDPFQAYPIVHVKPKR